MAHLGVELAYGGGRKGAVVNCELFAGAASVRVEVMRHVGHGAWAQTALQEVWPAGDVHLAIAWYRRAGGCLGKDDGGRAHVTSCLIRHEAHRVRGAWRTRGTGSS